MIGVVRIMMWISATSGMLMVGRSKARSFKRRQQILNTVHSKEEAKSKLHVVHVIMLIPKNAKYLLALQCSA
jgi:hypothetical protein